MDETTLLEVVRSSCNQMILLLEASLADRVEASSDWRYAALDSIKRVRARLQLVKVVQP